MSAFQELNIFEDTKMNEICDRITSIVKDITGDLPILCGSLAKIFSGILDEKTYEIKDVDFFLTNWNFRKLKHHFPKEIVGIRMIEKRPERMILFCENNKCIELWCNLEKEENKKVLIKNNKIPYKNYGS